MTQPATIFTFTVLAAKDPTRTTILRGQMVAEIKRRFKAVKKEVLKVIVEEDRMGLRPTPSPRISILAGGKASDPKQWIYRHDAGKIEVFKDWLDTQVEANVLELVPNPLTGEINPWTNNYIQTAYQRGILKARADLKKEGVDLPPVAPFKGILETGFNLPIHQEAIQPIFTRVWTDLKGVTEVMSTQMSHILALGMAEGKNPFALGKLLAERIDKIGVTRGALIARTEIIRTHNLAALKEYERAEAIIGEEILVQWQTAEDERVRVEHIARNGKVYKREKAQSMLGEPNCRCALLPYVPSMHKKKPVRRRQR